MGRPRRMSSCIDERASGATPKRGSTRRTKTGLGRARTRRKSAGGGPRTRAGSTPAARASRSPSAIHADQRSRHDRSASWVTSGWPDSAFRALLRLMSSLDHCTASMSSRATVRSRGSAAATVSQRSSGRPSTIGGPALTITSPSVVRRAWPGRSSTTLKGTMPARTSRPGRAARSRSTLRTPFCRLTTTASGGACAAMSSAIEVVSRLLVVTRMSAAPANAAAGSVVTGTSPGASAAPRPRWSSERSPCWATASTRRCRPSSRTCSAGRTAPASSPPMYWPMAPAPATATIGGMG